MNNLLKKIKYIYKLTNYRTEFIFLVPKHYFSYVIIRSDTFIQTIYVQVNLR